MQESQPRKLLVSILSLGKPEQILRQLPDLTKWLSAFGASAGILVHLAIRNNHPRASFTGVVDLIHQIRTTCPDMEITLFSGGPNLGFGGGHNENFRLIPSDFTLILNDDIGFPHLDWLAEAVSILDRDGRTALVADAGSPQDLNPFFANGTFSGPHHLHTLKYAEASVLFLRSAAFAEIGMFNPKIDWAMCEDADLSLRAQQHGYRLAWLPIPHQHWRSTSFNSLPGSVRSSFLEHNRATLFSTWRNVLTTGEVGRFVVYDLWSDGIGDIFCALPHLAAELRRLTPRERAHVVINTPELDLMRLLAADVRIVRHEDVGALDMALGGEGIAAIHSIRNLNYSLPIDIQALVCGALSLRVASAAQLAEFRATLVAKARTEQLPSGLAPGTYCVLHLEFTRGGHHGRALTAARSRELLRVCASVFETVVLLGKERRLIPPKDTFAGRIVDLQGSLSQEKLLALIASAQAFVGIDSFPAHVAQAAGVPAAIFFGSVHPLTRIWDSQKVWPITAALDCIGCYHTHLEPSVPFCMRYDEACSGDVEVAQMTRALEMLVAGTPFDWFGLTLRFRALQSQMVHFLRNHPAPPSRMFRDPLATNEQVSGLIYEMTDKMAEMLRDQYQTSAVRSLAGRVADLEAQTFAQEAELEESRRQIRVRLAPPAASVHQAAAYPTQILQIKDLPITPVRCRLVAADPWLQVISDDEDPQLFLPVMEGRGGRVRLRLSCVAEALNVMQLFWASSLESFSLERMEEMSISPTGGALDRVFDLGDGELLCLRIDPLAGTGRMRLRGSLVGALRLPVTTPVPVPEPVAKIGALACRALENDDTVLAKHLAGPADGSFRALASVRKSGAPAPKKRVKPGSHRPLAPLGKPE